MLIETHAHLDYPDFDGDREAVLDRASGSGIEALITIGTRIESSRRAVQLAAQWPQVWATVGIHPADVDDAPNDYLAQLEVLAVQPRVAALGEIGLDYYRPPGDDSTPDRPALIEAWKIRQRELFRSQLDLAARLGLNAVIHQRGDCWPELVSILSEFTGRVRGVVHCFGGTVAQAEEILALGHLVSFTGLVTFKNARVIQETASRLPLHTFMVETDCPYLAPVPFRGQRCEPSHTRMIAQKIADLRGQSLDSIAAATSATAREFFRLEP